MALPTGSDDKPEGDQFNTILMDAASRVDMIVPIVCQCTAQHLRADAEALSSVQWQNGEANTDMGYSQFTRRCCRNVLRTLSWPGVAVEVLDHRTKGDVLLRFTVDGTTVINRKIELKSGKTTTITGSCCLKLDLNQWVIWCLRTKAGFDVRYGQYNDSILGINDPKLINVVSDRSSRPRVHYRGLQSPSSSPRPMNHVSLSASEWAGVGARNSVRKWVNNGAGGSTWSEMFISGVATEFVSLVESGRGVGHEPLQRLIDSRRALQLELLESERMVQALVQRLGRGNSSRKRDARGRFLAST
jgi:hypothetical protein